MIEKLYEASATKSAYIVELMDAFGEDYWYVQHEILVVDGMKDAFNIVAGCSYTDYLLNRARAELDYAV